MAEREVDVRDAEGQFQSRILQSADLPAPLAALAKSANVPAVSTGALVLLSDVITALGTLQASHNDLLAKLKAAGIMVAD